ncbi:MAG: DUF1732 domain-containing protein [Turneriella sp.]|nr:DUF1732 domain-containing protein [Turneriella sp.]
MESMTGYGESHFSAEGVQIVCTARSLNSRFLDIDLNFPEELAWFRAHSEEIIRKRFKRGRIEISLQSAAPLPVDVVFNVDIISQYERFLSQRLGKKKFTLDPREFLNMPGFVERRVKDWRAYQGKFDFHLLRALIKMQRGRIAEGKRTTRACTTHLRYLARVQRQIGVLHAQSHRRKLNHIRHRILEDFFGQHGSETAATQSHGGRGRRAPAENTMRVAKLIWNERKDEILRSVHNDASEEISRIGMHIARMLQIFRKNESAGRELEFFLQELQREANTIGAKAQDSEINNLVVIMKTEIEKLREQVRNLE